MDFKFPSQVKLKVIAVLVLYSITLSSSGQQTPFYPVSYRILTPFILNPAIAGTKDFFSVDVLAGKTGNANSQMLSGNMRLSKTAENYIASPGIPEFTNIGVGGYVFTDYNGSTRNTGVAAAGSYHFQLDKNSLSFLSVGVAAKVIFNRYSGNSDLGEASSSKTFADFDAGLYYYRTNFYAGISATNLMGTPENPDTTSSYVIPVSRQIFFNTGYKLVLSRSRNILLEPSIIFNTDDKFSGDILDMIQPALKLYAGSFCVGTYFNDFDRFSFFFQYRYNSFYVGAFFSMPHNSPFYKTPLVEEIAIGINLSSIKSGISRVYHW
jgi:type IX secretion system PorP/SprF family membrane protein